MIRTTATLVLLGSIVAAPAFGQNQLKDIPDPDPEIERKSFQVAEGFEVNLFAADPILAKPLQINWDPAGRLWVACSEVYPQIKPGQVANDKVLILEDRDGDGKADETTVFADGLLIPTGVEPGDGGAYVANSTELLHLKDTDGDGKADTRRVMLSGFGTEDTHHILHTLRWGPDGMLHMNQSTYIHSHIETPWGVRRLGGGGIWQFRPESMRLEVFIRGLINPWGHQFDDWGQQFATDGAGGEGINYLIPGASYAWTPGEKRIVAGLNPGSPKHCGLEVASGRHLPDDWQGSLLTNDFRANRVCRFVLSDDGSGFASREQPELIKTRHVAFRPIDVKMGPDGAIYVADWYNPIIQHGEVDFRDPRRDHTRGRIWRVTAKGRPLVERPRLADASIPALLDALKSPEGWTRHQAKRLLKERGAKAVVPALAAWVEKLGPEEEQGRLEALWAYQSLDVAEPKLLTAVLGSKDFRSRAAAVRVLGHWRDRVSEPLEQLAKGVEDEHPRVRLEAVRALALFPGPASVESALKALDRPTDRFLDHALWLTARDLAPTWLPAVTAGTFDFGGNAKHLLFALEAASSPAVVGPLLETLKEGKVPPDRVAGVLGLVASVGGPDEMGQVLDLALAETGEKVRRADLLAGLVQATQQRKVRPKGDLARIGGLLDDDDATRSAAARAVGAWKVESLRARLEELVRDGAVSVEVRGAAIEGVAGLGGPASVAALDRLSESDGSVEVRRRAIVGLAGLDANAAARRAVAELGNGEGAAAIVAGFVGRQGGAEALASALKGRTLPPDAAKLALRAARSAGRAEPGLVEALNKAGGLTAGPIALAPAELEALVAEVAKVGDPARGEAVFRRKDQECLKCHAIAGAGGRVGPGLESVGASAPVDYLIASLLEPDKAIKEGHHSLVVATDDGRVVSGIKVREDDKVLVLRDADDRDVTIPAASIEDRKQGGSLMPAGMADSLTRGELVDLVRFLSELGKVGPFAVGKAPVARRWQVLDATPEAVEDVRNKGKSAALDLDLLSWSAAYSRVAGDLPLADLPALQPGPSAPKLGVARCWVEVTTAGPVGFRLNSGEGVSVWVDGEPADSARLSNLELRSGVRTLTFAVDLGRRAEGLRCELVDVPGSPARAGFVGGK